MKQRYICCAYISTNSKIYDILQLKCTIKNQRSKSGTLKNGYKQNTSAAKRSSENL